MKITTNPSTEASGFGHVAEGDYKLRVFSVEQKMKPGGEHPYLEWRFDYTDPNVKCVDNPPHSKESMRPGQIFENTTLKPDAQWKLRQVSDALGWTWGSELDTDDAIGQEFDAHVVVGQNNRGEPRNEIGRYVPKS